MAYVFSALSLVSIGCGLICIIIAITQHNPEQKLFGKKTPINPFKLRPWFKSDWGFKLGVSGGFLLSLGGLLGLIRQYIT